MGEPKLMKLEETDRIRTFDIDSFVSYQTAEDVTPTAAELVEEIPQHLMPVGPTDEEIAAKAAKPRRGKAYLRTEVDEESVAQTSEAEADDFGAGIESDLPATADHQSDRRASSTAETDVAEPGKASASSTDAPGRKRKRRRKRRSRSAGRRDGDTGAGDPKPADHSAALSTDATATVSDGQPPSTEQDGDSSATAATAGKKRRRRRRRRRKGAAPAAGNSDATNSDTNSSPTAE